MKNEQGCQFGPTLKRWFKANGWPQGITQDWAYAVESPNGPWASQISKAMNDKLEPKPDFFLSFGRFNQAVAERDLKGISDRRLIDRLRNGQPLCHDNGTPFDAPSFFSLFTGLIEAPELPDLPVVITQKDVDQWIVLIRSQFKKISLKHMCDRAEAWQMLSDEIDKSSPMQLTDSETQWIQEILCGLHEPTVKEVENSSHLYLETSPIQIALEALLTVKKTETVHPVAEVAYKAA